MQKRKQNYTNLVKISIWILCGWVSVYGLVQSIYFNPTISETKGYYLTYPNQEYHKGDIVLLCVVNQKQLQILHRLKLPYSQEACPYNAPYLLKRIVATAGDQVMISEAGIVINGSLYPHSVGLTKYKDILLSPLSSGSFSLKADEYFMLGQTPHSYDSRYFGPISKQQIYRKAILIWPAKYLLWQYI
jgi:signal peptidase I